MLLISLNIFLKILKKNLIYIDGKPDHKIDSTELAEHLEGLIRDKIEKIKEQDNNLILKS